jgi:hypothetical protein
MNFAQLMWTVWASLAAITENFYFFRARLNHDAADQIFLDDSFDHERVEQAAIAAKVTKIESVVKVAQWLMLAMTLVVIGYYLRDILVQLNVMG